MKLRRTLCLFLSLTSTVGLFVGCGARYENDGDGTTVFESDAPGGSLVPGKGSYAAGAIANDAAEVVPTVDGDSTGGAATRAIEEADIIKLEGTRLYALSQYGGLNVIDVSNPDDLRLLGRKKVAASPFEMYVRDSIVFGLYNGYGDYVEGSTAGEWSWVQTSYVMAFDTTDAAHPEIVGKFAIPGTISDSRIVGNILYVVGYEANSCWNCEDGQHTTVLSLDVSRPSEIHQVDRLSYADDTTSSYSWQRSISVNDQRMYVAGPEWGNNGPVGSTIQVIDISNPNGALVEGATIQAAGSVNSRWQMDEYDGNLRVISQPGSWSVTDTVRIQTYQVDSAQSITKLANVAMTTPANESLRSVRFDGTRAYAVTAMQTDPLFTIDLTDPAQPRQAGSLAMPGWIYYMEPRGERLVSLGYDQGNADGALAISLFNVSNLDAPTMLDRVNFGGDWSWIAEGQDQVQKAFQVLDANHLILMPFSGWQSNNDVCGTGGYLNGIQLVDWQGDDLKLSGVANLVGQPRRGFLYDDRLFAVSEERVETFDITDRTSPVKKDSLKTANIVNSTVVAGKTVVKVAQDWYSSSVSLDTTTLANVEQPQELGHIDIAFPKDGCNSTYLGTVAASNDRVYLVLNSYAYDVNFGTKETFARLVTVDVSSATSPKVIGDAKLDFTESWSAWYNSNLVNAGAQAVAVGNTFVLLSSNQRYDAQGNYLGTDSTLHVLDVTDPSQPKDTPYQVDTDYGTTGLYASGSTIAFGYYTASSSDAERVRFYVDRIDVADPTAPKHAGPVNVPGALIAFDESSSNAVTVDYRKYAESGLTMTECNQKYNAYSFQFDNDVYVENGVGTCYAMQQTVRLAKLASGSARILGSKALEIGERISSVAAGTDRLFMTLGSNTGYYATALDCLGCGYSVFQESALPLLVVGGLASDEFALGRLELSSGNSWNYWGSAPMVAAGDRALLSTGWQGKLVVVDGSNPETPSVVRQADVIGSVAQLTVTAGIGIASLYYDGVQTIPITE